VCSSEVRKNWTEAIALSGWTSNGRRILGPKAIFVELAAGEIIPSVTPVTQRAFRRGEFDYPAPERPRVLARALL
jgi:hypothetical protein